MSPKWLWIVQESSQRQKQSSPEGGGIRGPRLKTGILTVVDGLNSKIHDERRRTELTE
jgi:hypothetical protein